MQPKVTVLMPVWNAQRTLQGAIESILTQTCADFELVVVDDGSTDETPQLLRDYRDVRVRVLRHPKNLGLTHSLNAGLAESRGRYVARMNADDVSSPQRLARLADLLDANPQVAFATSHASRIDRQGARVGVHTPPADSETLRRQLRIDDCLVHGAAMLRREAVEQLGGYDASLERAQEYDLWLRGSERYELATLPATLYASRVREDASRVDEAPFHARVRHAARARFCAGLTSAVSEGAVSPVRAAQRALEVLQQEEALRLQAAGRRIARLWQRLPGLHLYWHRLAHLDALGHLLRELEAVAAGWQSADAASRKLVTGLEALAPEPEAPSEDSTNEEAP